MAALVSSMQGAALRPQFARSVRRTGSSAPARVAPHTRTGVVTHAAASRPKFAYMSRDAQRHDKLVALLDAELETSQGLSATAQIALAKDLILRGIGLEDADALVGMSYELFSFISFSFPTVGDRRGEDGFGYLYVFPTGRVLF